MSLEEIIQGCKKGNRKSQDALVQKFAPGLMALCSRYVSDTGLAQDALQETFIAAFKYMDTYTGEGNFNGWIRKIAVNTSLTVYKKYHKIKFDSLNDGDEYRIPIQQPEVEDDMNADQVLKLLRLLPESMYLVFNLHVIEGYHHQEIATLLNINEKTSRAALSKAKTRLKDMIKKSATLSHTAIISIDKSAKVI